MAAVDEVVAYSPKFSELNADYFYIKIPKVIESYHNNILRVKSNTSYSWENSIQPLEEGEEALSRCWSQLEHLNAVANTKEIRAAYDALLPKVTNFQTDIIQDQELYKIYLNVKNSPAFSKLSDAQRIIVDNALRDFKLAGVDLPDTERKKFKELIEKLSETENAYSNNVLDATEGWTCHIAVTEKTKLSGLPENALETAAAKAKEQGKDGWVLTLEYPCYAAVMGYVKNRELRHDIYIAYNTKASDQGPNAGKWDNTKNINQILDMRRQICNLVGYTNFAEYSLATKMASNLPDVMKFLGLLASRAKPKAQEEVQRLLDYANKIDGIDKLEAWDIAYYSEMYKKQNFGISDEELRVYFPEPKVLTGLFKLVQTIYGISISEMIGVSKWHDSVRMFKVVDKSNKIRGYFYTDLYAREGKRSGAWMAECATRMIHTNNKLQLPIAYLNCNFAAPIGNNPGLLTHDDVITLFHEFGHTLHHLLTQVNYYSASGINGVAWDAVELPSQFMENWCWEWSVIHDISANISDGKPLPKSIFDKLLATKTYHAALALVRQLEFTLFDLRIHANFAEDQGQNVQQILDSVRAQVSVISLPKENRFQNSFSHIFAGGYAAGYYGYLWAEVLSCDAFAIFKAANLFSAEVGNAFLTEILEKGGSKPAMELFIAFAGREPEVDALLQHHAIA